MSPEMQTEVPRGWLWRRIAVYFFVVAGIFIVGTAVFRAPDPTHIGVVTLICVAITVIVYITSATAEDIVRLVQAARIGAKNE